MNAHFDEFDQAVKRLNAGDKDARGWLIEASFDRLRKLARKMIGGFPTVQRWEDTDDLLQRAAIRLLKSIEVVELESTRHFLNLATLQIRRELIEMARSLQGPAGLAQNHDSVVTNQSSPAPARPSDTYEPTSLASWTEFHQGVANMPEESREVFELVWYQGLSQQDVAKLLDVSQASVSRRWQKAIRFLAKLMETY